MSSKRTSIPIIKSDSVQGKKFFSALSVARQHRDAEVTVRVQEIIDSIRAEGDGALLRYIQLFDKVTLTASSLRVSQKEIDEAASRVPAQLSASIKAACRRIEAYHRKQLRKGFTYKTKEGTLEQLIVPLQRVGVYIPGGHAVYPSSVLMNVIPAKVAGVADIVAITPPRAELDPAIAFALKYLDIKEVYRMGGAQGIAALALGTKTIGAVDKITGPGNAYVQTAKRLLYGIVDIDSIAGPSEVAIIADKTASPEVVALDLLSQAEHGSGDEFAVCVTEDAALAERIAAAVAREIAASPVKAVFEKLPGHAIVVMVTPSRADSIAIVNKIAPEHLQIMTADPRKDLRGIRNASAIFLGTHTPVALGDYFIGTNHVLPTGGAARFASPLGVDSFVKRISVAEVTPEGLDLSAPYVSVFARAEGFVHHALSVERRS